MTFPNSRPVGYDETLVYDFPTESWIFSDGRGGARYRETVIVVARRSDGTGLILFGDI